MTIVNFCSSFDKKSLQYWRDSSTTCGCAGDCGEKGPFVVFERSEVRNA